MSSATSTTEFGDDALSMPVGYRSTDRPRAAAASLRDELRRTGKRLYCVTFTIRSGSSLLCQDLRHWGIGDPAEWFQSPLYAGHRRQRAVASYVLGLIESSPSPVVGFKISWGQACVLAESLRREGQPVNKTDLTAVFPGLRFVHLTRRDKIQQAVSAWRAVATGRWHYTAGEDRLTGGPHYDFDAINRHYQRILVEDELWNTYFARHAIQPLRLEYEQYAADRRAQMEVVADFVGARPTETSIAEDLLVMRDVWTDAMVSRFWSDMNELVDAEAPGLLATARRRLAGMKARLSNEVAGHR